MTDHVLRADGDVTCGFLTEVLRERGWIGDATVVDAPGGDGRGRAHGHLRAVSAPPGPRGSGRAASVVGKFAAQDATAASSWRRAAIRTSSASTGTSSSSCVSIRAPRCAVRRDRRRRVVHAHPRGLRADGAGRSAARVHRQPRWRPRSANWWACTCRSGTPPTSTRTRASPIVATSNPSCWRPGWARSSPASSGATAARSRRTRWRSTSGSRSQPPTGSPPAPPRHGRAQ